VSLRFGLAKSITRQGIFLAMFSELLSRRGQLQAVGRRGEQLSQWGRWVLVQQARQQLVHHHGGDRAFHGGRLCHVALEPAASKGSLLSALPVTCSRSGSRHPALAGTSRFQRALQSSLLEILI